MINKNKIKLYKVKEKNDWGDPVQALQPEVSLNSVPLQLSTPADYYTNTKTALLLCLLSRHKAVRQVPLEEIRANINSSRDKRHR